MNWLLIVGIIVGGLLPIAVAVVTVALGTPKNVPGGYRVAFKFGKGIAFGALGGLSVAAVVIGLTLALKAATSR